MPLRRPSFSTVLAVAAISQVALVTVLSAAVYVRASHIEAHEAAERIGHETAERVEEDLARFLQAPRSALSLLSDAIAKGDLDPADTDQAARSFGRLLTTFPELAFVTLGLDDGRYLSVERTEDGQRHLAVVSEADTTQLVERRLLADGSWSEPEALPRPFDATESPWYELGRSAEGLRWTEPYPWAGRAVLCLDAVQQLIDPDGEAIGVLDAGFTVDHLATHLAKVHISESGQVYVVDANGHIVASSVDEVLTVDASGRSERVAASDSAHPLVRAAAEAIEALSQEGPPPDGSFTTEVGGQALWVQVRSLPPESGLDWRVVVAVPPSDFLGHLDRSRTQALYLLAALTLAGWLIGLLTAQWIRRPLAALAGKARSVRDGERQVEFVEDSADEIGTLAGAMGEMIQAMEERERIREAFGLYVSPRLVEEVLSNPMALEPGGEVVDLTVLMSDLRGYTRLTARLGPKGTVDLLNAYLERMSEVITSHGGMINEFIGDAILVLFGAPHPQADDAERAARCAVDMQEALRAFNAENPDTPDLDMGIGLNSGRMILGNIGSRHRVKYGVIGDPVNTTARIESLTVGSQILVSAATAERVAAVAVLGPASHHAVKGKSEPLEVRAVHGIVGGPMLEGAAGPLAEVERELRFVRLRGKAVQEGVEQARTLTLGPTGATLSGTTAALLDELRVELRWAEGDWSEHIYAKVIAVEPKLELRFTSVGPEDTEKLRALL